MCDWLLKLLIGKRTVIVNADIYGDLIGTTDNVFIKNVRFDQQCLFVGRTKETI